MNLSFLCKKPCWLKQIRAADFAQHFADSVRKSLVEVF